MGKNKKKRGLNRNEDVTSKSHNILTVSSKSLQHIFVDYGVSHLKAKLSAAEPCIVDYLIRKDSNKSRYHLNYLLITFNEEVFFFFLICPLLHGSSENSSTISFDIKNNDTFSSKLQSDCRRHYIRKIIRDDRRLSKLEQIVRSRQPYKSEASQDFSAELYDRKSKSDNEYLFRTVYDNISNKKIFLPPYDGSNERDHHSNSFHLPIFPYKRYLLAAIQHSPILLVAGDTGCGKTTQLPQYILDAETDTIPQMDGGYAIQSDVAFNTLDGVCESNVRIVCVQPRRVAAVSVAERVAFERGERCGDVVGYQVKLPTYVLF